MRLALVLGRPLCVLALLGACAWSDQRAARGGSVAVQRATFQHAGFGAGPVVFTGGNGALLEERRFEPFGAAIGAPDLEVRDLGAQNQRIDVASGWSDHGARWLAPETARWLAPDPPVIGPAPRLVETPWGLHPYQYVDQNPVAYWDPDGREPAAIHPKKVPVIIRDFSHDSLTGLAGELAADIAADFRSGLFASLLDRVQVTAIVVPTTKSKQPAHSSRVIDILLVDLEDPRSIDDAVLAGGMQAERAIDWMSDNHRALGAADLGGTVMVISLDRVDAFEQHVGADRSLRRAIHSGVAAHEGGHLMGLCHAATCGTNTRRYPQEVMSAHSVLDQGVPEWTDNDVRTASKRYQ